MTEQQKKYGPNKKLREYRMARHWTQETFAARIGVAVQTLRRWESGQHAPPTPMRERLCQELGTTPQQLGFEPEEEIFVPSMEKNSFGVAEQVTISPAEEETSVLEEGSLASELQKGEVLGAQKGKRRDAAVLLSGCSSMYRPISFLKAHVPALLLLGFLSFSLLGGAFFALRVYPSQTTSSSSHAVCFSDEFSAGEALDGWQWVDEDRDADRNLDQRGLSITAFQADKNLWKYNNNAPRLVQPVQGDFLVETQVEFVPHVQYQGAGLLVYGDSTHFLRLEHAFSQFEGIEFEPHDPKYSHGFTSLSSTAYLNDVKLRSVKVSALRVQLQLRRVGDQFTAFWRLAEPNQDWRLVGKAILHLSRMVRVGLLLVSDSKEQPVLQAVAHYNYFHIVCSKTL